MPVGGKPLTLTLGLQPAQNRLSETLPFVAQALQIDNFTNQWLFLVEGGVYIPPYFTDRVILLPNVSTITALVMPPPSYPQAGLVKGQQAIFIPFAEWVQPSTGAYQAPSSLPALQTVQFAQPVAPGQSKTILAGKAGAIITVYGYAGTINAGAGTVGPYQALILSSATSVSVAAAQQRIQSAGTSVSAVPLGPLWIAPGTALPVGEGLVANAPNTNADSIDIVGSFYLIQQ